MQYTDNRPILQQSYLRVTGSVCNVGSNPAYNSRLHVIAYSGNAIVIDTDIDLGTGTLAGGSGVNVDSHINYSGSALTNVITTTIWTTTP